MAEEAKEAASSGGSGPGPQAQKPILFIILAVVNMLVVAGVGFMLYKNKQKEELKPTIDNVIQGEHEKQKEEAEKIDDFVTETLPLETFLVNLAGSSGGKLVKVNMELEIEDQKVREEIDKRKSQIRDMIIILLSTKSYDQLSTRDGKEGLRNEIKENLNSFLTKGKIKRVLFTDFILN